MFKHIFVCVLLMGLSGSVIAQTEATISVGSLPIKNNDAIQYMRLSANEESLQVALVRFQPRSGDKTWFVDLVSAVHVADKAYYDELNKRFNDAVLYELVAPEGTKIPYQTTVDKESQSTAGKADWQRAKSPITLIQTMMTDILGLSFQMDAVDYSANHFIHADFSPQEFSDSMEARGETIFGMVLQLWRAGLAKQLTAGNSSNMDIMQLLMASDKQLALKQLMAKEFVGSEAIFDAFEGAEGSTLVAARNQKALKVLKRTLIDKKPESVAIFYGAGHMQDFQQRLITDFDLVPVSVEWIDAWSLTEQP